ncbi:HAD-like protein [Mycena sanguinolenta]|uniref:HAD-like protein n=1 Tax=Mycena sanguinolenta TaxID=230812 RepID=A0A8H6YYD8_9AGAR|nr:HAD-like protein [Mycena sanguinolenta]
MVAVIPLHQRTRRAMVSDLMGTCTGWKSSIIASLERQPPMTVDLPSLAAAWRSGFFKEIHRQFERGEPQEDIDTTHRALDTLLDEAGIGLVQWDEDVGQALVNSWHNQTSWSEGIELLKQDYLVFSERYNAIVVGHRKVNRPSFSQPPLIAITGSYEGQWFFP